MFEAFDRLFDRAASKLKVECTDEERDEAKRQFGLRFAALLEALGQIQVERLPDEVIGGMEAAIDRVTPTEVAGMLAAIPIAHQAQEMMRVIAHQAAEQRLLEHLIEQADDRYGGN